MAAVTFAIIQAPASGWTSAAVLGPLIAALVALGALLRYDPHRAEPLIDLRFFRSTPFSASIVISIAAFAAFGGFLFLNTLYLQDTRDLSPIGAGLATLPLALMTIVISPISGRLVGRRGPRLPLILSGLGTIVGSAMLAGVGAATPMIWLLAAYTVFGIGFGFVNAPITNAAVSGMPREQAGVASAVATTSRQFGQTLGVATIGAIVASSHHGAGLASTGRPAWWTLSALGVAVLALGLLATTTRAKASAQRTAVQLNPEALTAAAAAR
jgi:MFS family permease